MATAISETGRRAQLSKTISLEARSTSRPTLPRWAAFLLIFGLFLTLRGYHAFDGDQAYRLPLLLHRQDPSLYANDSFVRAFDAFNPHRGYLAMLDLASRPAGLAVGLAGLFGLTLVATSLGVDRLARSVWPAMGGRVGLVAVVLVLVAKAGNLGTNHLFEATLLDRLVGFALGWFALATAVGEPRRGVWVAALCLGFAFLIHPSVALQLAIMLAATWGVWSLLPKKTGVGRFRAMIAIAALGLGLAPGLILMAGQGGHLFSGLPPEEFRLLAVMVQGPQHMLPSTWRMAQWLAWGCYPVLAILAFTRTGLDRDGFPWPPARTRLAILMSVNLASLGLAYLAVEVVGDLRVTIFQPFRMASLARGLALVAISGRILSLWNRRDFASRGRAMLVGNGLTGDWAMVVASAIDLGMEALEWAEDRRIIRSSTIGRNLVGLVFLGSGLVFLARHDTESGHWPLLMGLGALAIGTPIARLRPMTWTPRRVVIAMTASWMVPVAAWVAGFGGDPSRDPWTEGLVSRCRFAEIPTDDLERLAVWCRDHTSPSARFIGPPGPKTFRYWSRRALAFNRAGSPYHAAGLADWSGRYRDHVGFTGTTVEFVRAYLADRHALEARYSRMTAIELANLAERQGADHVLTMAPVSDDPEGSLELLRKEGRYAVYRIRPAMRLDNREAIFKKISTDSLPHPPRKTRTGS